MTVCVKDLIELIDGVFLALCCSKGGAENNKGKEAVRWG